MPVSRATRPTSRTDAAHPSTASVACACGRLRRATRALTQLYDDLMAPAGLRLTQFSLLRTLARDGPLKHHRTSRRGNCSIARRCRAISTHWSTAVSWRSFEVHDARTKEVAITRKGTAALRAAEPYWKRAQKEVAQRIGARKLDALIETLGELESLHPASARHSSSPLPRSASNADGASPRSAAEREPISRIASQQVTEHRMTSSNTATPSWRTPTVVLVCGGLILTLAMGIRHGFGLFLQPISADMHWGRETFALALAVQNLVWGATQPFAGMLADKYGTGRVVLGGAILYVARTRMDGVSDVGADVHPVGGRADRHRPVRRDVQRDRGFARSRVSAGEAQHGARHLGRRRIVRAVRAAAADAMAAVARRAGWARCSRSAASAC